MQIKEAIIVEGRDDTAAIKRAASCLTIETHGFGISKETLRQIQTAYEKTGIIIFTDPDHTGEMIRKKLTEAFPLAKHAWLTKDQASGNQHIGVEFASPQAIQEALQKAHCVIKEAKQIFSMKDLNLFGLTGKPGASQKRQQLGSKLGIGYGNSKTFLDKLNRYGISRETFLNCLEDKES